MDKWTRAAQARKKVLDADQKRLQELAASAGRIRSLLAQLSETAEPGELLEVIRAIRQVLP